MAKLNRDLLYVLAQLRCLGQIEHLYNGRMVPVMIHELLLFSTS
jgi:hypothetical protein